MSCFLLKISNLLSCSFRWFSSYALFDNQSVDLTASGSVTDAPIPSGRYTIAIIQTPLTFRYGDSVRLRCVIQPDPPHVQFEWQKDGQIIGRTSELFIPDFSPYDVGRYQCLARIEGYADMSSNATVLPGSEDCKSSVSIYDFSFALVTICLPLSEIC